MDGCLGGDLRNILDLLIWNEVFHPYFLHEEIGVEGNIFYDCDAESPLAGDFTFDLL